FPPWPPGSGCDRGRPRNRYRRRRSFLRSPSSRIAAAHRRSHPPSTLRLLCGHEKGLQRRPPAQSCKGGGHRIIRVANRSPQSHRDTEKTKEKNKGELEIPEISSVSLCLCGETLLNPDETPCPLPIHLTSICKPSQNKSCSSTASTPTSLPPSKNSSLTCAPTLRKSPPEKMSAICAIFSGPRSTTTLPAISIRSRSPNACRTAIEGCPSASPMSTPSFPGRLQSTSTPPAKPPRSMPASEISPCCPKSFPPGRLPCSRIRTA